MMICKEENRAIYNITRLLIPALVQDPFMVTGITLYFSKLLFYQCQLDSRNQYKTNEKAGTETKRPPPKPLYQRDDHRARIDQIQSEIDRTRRQQYDYDYSQRRQNSPIRLGTHQSYESRLDRASDVLYDPTDLQHQERGIFCWKDFSLWSFFEIQSQVKLSYPDFSYILPDRMECANVI